MAIRNASGGYFMLREIASGVLPGSSGNISIALWYYVSGLPTTIQQMHYPASSGDTTGTSIGFRGSGAPCAWKGGGTILVTCSGTAPAAQVWHHVVYTCSGQTSQLYVDGGLAGSGAVAPDASWNTVLSNTYAQTERFHGFVDDLRIYNRTLSEAEALTIYSSRGSDGIVNGMVSRILGMNGKPGNRIW